MRLAVECRSEIRGDTLSGHAAVFDQIARLPRHWEALARTAFDEALERGDDAAALVNHDPSLILGRRSAGTLRLDVDRRGLAFEVDLPDTSYAHDLRTSIGRGDIAGMSFGFVPGKVTDGRARDGRQLRTHTSVARLLDISPVTYPAYQGTDLALRAVVLDTEPNRQRLIRARARCLERTVK
jgi:HK97 family phage prohead protease